MQITFCGPEFATNTLSLGAGNILVPYSYTGSIYSYVDIFFFSSRGITVWTNLIAFGTLLMESWKQSKHPLITLECFLLVDVWKLLNINSNQESNLIFYFLLNIFLNFKNQSLSTIFSIKTKESLMVLNKLI